MWYLKFFCCCWFFFFFCFCFVFRERESTSGGDGQRERKRESQAGFTPSMDPNLGLNPTTPGSWPDPKLSLRSTNWAIQVPQGNVVWWLSLCINLTGLKDAIWLVKQYFWVCQWGCFWKRWTFDSVDCVKKIHTYWCEQAQIEQKWEKGDSPLSLLELGDLSSPALGCQNSWLRPLNSGLTPVVPRFSVLLPEAELYHWLSWLFSLQTVDYGTSRPPLPCEPMPIKNLF